MIGVSFCGLRAAVSRAGAYAVIAGRKVIEVGRKVRPAAVVAVSGAALAACNSLTMPGVDAFKSGSKSTLLLIESTPAGAEAKASFGKACRTPCTMLISQGEDFMVSFTLDGYRPETLPVHVTMNPGDWRTEASPILEPGTLFPTLQSLKPPPVGRKPKTAAAAAAAVGTAQ